MDVAVADGGDGDDHAVDGLEEGEAVLAVVLCQVEEAGRGPPERQEGDEELQQPHRASAIHWLQILTTTPRVRQGRKHLYLSIRFLIVTKFSGPVK